MVSYCKQRNKKGVYKGVISIAVCLNNSIIVA